MIPANFYVTDANEVPGNIYRVQDGTESIIYSRSNRRIYSMAYAKNGRLFFVNANENYIYMVFRFLWWTFTFRVFNHSTYIRDIAFDSDGRLYFSEATGAGGDGKIYRIEGGSAVLYQDVPLSDVDGYWAGDFTFDPRDVLYISSGNHIPASLYRYSDGSWINLFTDDSEPIRGLSFLSCSVLCYANWRSEVYLYNITTGSRDLIYSNPAHLWLADIAFYRPKIDEDTQYEGTKTYSCDSNGACWRDDGSADDTWDFTDINANNADITALMASIGAPTTATIDDSEIWNRTRTVWAWLQTHGLSPGDPHYDDVVEYRAALGHWPSIAEFAYMFTTWNGFFWGGCTCMCRAQTFATLLYRVGIPINRLAIAETRWKPTYSQHMYIVLRLGCRWFYVDPSVNIPELPAEPNNIGGGTADYIHPNKLKVFAGSTLNKPMLTG